MSDVLKSALTLFNNTLTTPATSNTSEFVGQTVELGDVRLKVTKQIAEGGFAFVYVAKEVTSNRHYALKRLLSSDVENAKKVMREIDVLKRLNGHPNIVRYLWAAAVDKTNSGHGRDEYIVVTELCTGGSMVDVLQLNGKALSPEPICQIMYQTCRAVQHMHMQKPSVIHRDLKIENLLLGDDGLIRLCDFGSATCDDYYPDNSWTTNQRSALEEELAHYTTPMYRAPEMLDTWNNYPITSQVDIWALGCILFTLCFYRHPFEDSAKLAILNGNYRIPENDLKYQHFYPIIRGALKVDPRERFTVADMMERLVSIGESNQFSLRTQIKVMGIKIDTSSPKTASSVTPPPRPSHPSLRQPDVSRPISQGGSSLGGGASSGSLFSSLKGGANSFLKNIVDTSKTVMQSVQQSINESDNTVMNYVNSRRNSKPNDQQMQQNQNAASKRASDKRDCGPPERPPPPVPPHGPPPPVPPHGPPSPVPAHGPTPPVPHRIQAVELQQEAMINENLKKGKILEENIVPDTTCHEGDLLNISGSTPETIVNVLTTKTDLLGLDGQQSNTDLFSFSNTQRSAFDLLSSSSSNRQSDLFSHLAPPQQHPLHSSASTGSFPKISSSDTDDLMGDWTSLSGLSSFGNSTMQKGGSQPNLLNQKETTFDNNYVRPPAPNYSAFYHQSDIHLPQPPSYQNAYNAHPQMMSGMNLHSMGGVEQQSSTNDSKLNRNRFFNNIGDNATNCNDKTGTGPRLAANAFDDLLTGSEGFTFTRSEMRGPPKTINEMKKQEMAKDMDPNKMKVLDWTEGKRRNVRALLCSLHTVVWENCKWTECSMNQLITPVQIKKMYRKACLSIHPDKLVGTEHEALAKMIFMELNDAYTEFEKDETQQNLFR